MPIMPDGTFDRRIRAGLTSPLPGGAWELHMRGKPVREQLRLKPGDRLRYRLTAKGVSVERADRGS